jgi:hypothetical protein
MDSPFSDIVKPRARDTSKYEAKRVLTTEIGIIGAKDKPDILVSRSE